MLMQQHDTGAARRLVPQLCQRSGHKHHQQWHGRATRRALRIRSRWPHREQQRLHPSHIQRETHRRCVRPWTAMDGEALVRQSAVDYADVPHIRPFPAHRHGRVGTQRHSAHQLHGPCRGPDRHVAECEYKTQAVRTVRQRCVDTLPQHHARRQHPAQLRGDERLRCGPRRRHSDGSDKPRQMEKRRGTERCGTLGTTAKRRGRQADARHTRTRHAAWRHSEVGDVHDRTLRRLARGHGDLCRQQCHSVATAAMGQGHAHGLEQLGCPGFRREPHQLHRGGEILRR